MERILSYHLENGKEYVGQDELFVHVCSLSWDDHLVSDESGKNTEKMTVSSSSMKATTFSIRISIIFFLAHLGIESHSSSSSF